MNRSINKIPFARPSLGLEEEQAVLRVLRSGWLTSGKEVLGFEKEFAHFTGAAHALAVNSATAGLHLSLEALGVRPGTLVITTPYTFTASAEIIRYLGADPLFVDIQPSTYNMDPLLLEEALKKHRGRISGILPVHIAGLPCAMDSIHASGKKYGVPIVEDAAHAFPVKQGGRMTGSLGETGVFSFYANKTITTGEGGMIITDDDALAERMRIMRLHGINKVSWDRYTRPGASWAYEVVAPGFKYNMSDIAAAIGRVQLSRAEELKAKRRRAAEFYLRELKGCDFLTLPETGEDHAWHLFILRLNEEKLNINRDQFVALLGEQGIGCSVHFIPLHIMPYYRKQYGYAPGDFPRALENYRRSFSIPLYPDLTEADQIYIIETVKEIGKKERK